MRRWLHDFFRTGWAFGYWNARKTAFVLRRRRGVCPCHNPGDSGRALETGCEAVVGWDQPARFRRVCPLLRKNAEGRWVCGVTATEVRPFWGRAVGHGSVVAVACALVAATAVFAFMRGVGYEVSARQIFWPPAWHEVRAVRARLFIEQAREHFAQGRMREVMAALSSAQAVDPRNFQAGLLLAQFYEVGDPAFSDVLYRRLIEAHPERRAEVVRGWFRSLLARNRLAQVARLAREELAAGAGPETAVWVHALIFAAEQFSEPAWIDAAVADERIVASARTTLALAAKLLRTGDPAARAQLLRQSPLATHFPYDRIFRIEQLIAAGLHADAQQLLGLSRAELLDRDFARLVLAVYAASGQAERVAREFDALLAPKRTLTAAELNLLALHLIKYPREDLLDKLIAAMDRIRADEVEARVEAYVALFCAAGGEKSSERMHAVARALEQVLGTNLSALDPIENFFMAPRPQVPLERRLTALKPLSLGLIYELGAKYFQRPPVNKG